MSEARLTVVTLCTPSVHPAVNGSFALSWGGGGCEPRGKELAPLPHNSVLQDSTCRLRCSLMLVSCMELSIFPCIVDRN